MYQEDYILRHIRLFVKMIARIIGLIKEGDLGLALETVQVTFIDYLGMSIEDFLAYPDERMRDFLYFGELGSMGLNKTALAANLLTQTGRIYSLQGKPDNSVVVFEKAVRLLVDSYLEENGELQLPDFSPSVDEILAEVEIAKFSTSTLIPLAFYLEGENDLSKTYRIMRILVERNPSDPDIRDLAKSFYVYLLEEEAEVISKLGLTKSSLETMIQALSR